MCGVVGPQSSCSFSRSSSTLDFGVHERCLKELRSELTQRHEQELAQRVARHARETAAYVTRHEEDLRRTVARYEVQLLATRVPSSASASGRAFSVENGGLRAEASFLTGRGSSSASIGGRTFANEAGGLRVAPVEEVRWRQGLSRAEEQLEAQLRERSAELERTEGEAARYRKRAQRLKANLAEERRGLRARICEAVERALAWAPGAWGGQTSELLRAALLSWRGAVQTGPTRRPGPNCIDEARKEGLRALHSQLTERLQLAEDFSRSRPSADIVATSCSEPARWPVSEPSLASACRRCLEVVLEHGGRRAFALGPCPRLLIAVASRPRVTMAKALCSWSAFVEIHRHEERLRTVSGTAAQTAAALGVLRSEASAASERRRRRAEDAVMARALLGLAAPFGAWARDAAGSRRSSRPAMSFSVAPRTISCISRAARRLGDAKEVIAKLASLRSWSAAVLELQRETDLQSRLDDSCLQSSAALAALQTECHTLRARGHHIAGSSAATRALMGVVLAFTSWAREARHSKDQQLQEVTGTPITPSLDSGALYVDLCESRARGRFAAASLAEARDLLDLGVAYSAWARETARVVAARQCVPQPAQPLQPQARMRPADIVLDSGESARRKQRQLEEERVAAAERLAAAELEAAQAQHVAVAARRNEARSAALAARLEATCGKLQTCSILAAVVAAWASHRYAAGRDDALRRQREIAEKRLQTAVACAREEHKSALHQAWSDSLEQARKAAALERRLHATVSSRPHTAPGVVASLPLAASSLQAGRVGGQLRKVDVWPPLTGKEAEFATGPRVAAIGSRLLAALTTSQMEHWQARLLAAWRRLAAESRRSRELGRLKADALEQVMAAREGRKGIFMAAIGQQVRHTRGRALAAWRCATVDSVRIRALVASEACARAAGPPVSARLSSRGSPRQAALVRRG